VKKSDLKTGMRVTIRDGSQFIVLLGVPVKTQNQFVDILYNESSLLNLRDYDDNLFDRDYRKYDIIKVEIPHTIFDISYSNPNYDVIWERPLKELTLHDIEKELGCSVRIIGGTE